MLVAYEPRAVFKLACHCAMETRDFPLKLEARIFKIILTTSKWIRSREQTSEQNRLLENVSIPRNSRVLKSVHCNSITMGNSRLPSYYFSDFVIIQAPRVNSCEQCSTILKGDPSRSSLLLEHGPMTMQHDPSFNSNQVPRKHLANNIEQSKASTHTTLQFHVMNRGASTAIRAYREINVYEKERKLCQSW